MVRLESEGVEIRTDLTGIIIEKTSVGKKKKKLKDLFKSQYTITAGFKDTEKNTLNEGKELNSLTPKPRIRSGHQLYHKKSRFAFHRCAQT